MVSPIRASDVCRHAAFLAIAAAHAALIFGIGPLTTRTPAAAEPVPIEVTLTEERPPPVELPELPPQLISLSPPMLEPPLIDLPQEPDRTQAITMLKAEDTAQAGSPGLVTTITEVAYLRPPRPRYPVESRRCGEQGLVILKVMIDETGRAARIEIHRSSGHARLDAAARDAVEHALFKPYVENGVARAVLATIPIEFNWKGREGGGSRRS